MDVSDRLRLEKLVGMLGSAFDGERANAARMIQQMAERERKTIIELIFGKQAPKGSRPDKPQARKPQGKTRTILAALAEIIATEDEWEFTLTAWECQFARDVSSRYGHDYELSEKQIQVAERIIEKVELTRERSRPGA